MRDICEEPLKTHITIESRQVLNCMLCSAAGELLYKGLSDRLFGSPGIWNFRQCPNPSCGLIWLDPVPTEQDIGKAYTAYFTHCLPGSDQVAGGPALIKKFLKQTYTMVMYSTGVQKVRSKISYMYLGDTKPGLLLDVGCGDGLLLDRMRSIGWKVVGVEVDPVAAAEAEKNYGLQVHLGSLDEAGYPDGAFDAITMSHVVEHVYNPVSLLKECRRVLKPGGDLVVVTPNTNSLLHTRFKEFWMGLDPPRHLHLFSRATLFEVAERAGFSSPKVWTSAANAEVFALGSMDIQLDGTHKMGGKSSFSRKVGSASTQILAMFHNKRNPFSGEEIVLKVAK